MTKKRNKFFIGFLSLVLILTMMPLSAVPARAETGVGVNLYIIEDTTSDNPALVESSGSGAGWSWDKDSATLTLNGFNGSYIEADGAVTIKLKGTNTITARSDKSCAVSISGLLTIDKTVNDETDQLIIENSAMNCENEFYAIATWGEYYNQNRLNGGTVKINLTNSGSGKLYGWQYVKLYGNSNLIINLIGDRVSGVEGRLDVEENADVDITVSGRESGTTTAWGAQELSSGGSGQIKISADVNGDPSEAAAFSIGYLYLTEGGKITARGKIYQWWTGGRDLPSIDDSVKTEPAKRVLKQFTPRDYYLWYCDENGNKLSGMTFEYAATPQPLAFANPDGMFDIPENQVGTEIEKIYLKQGLNSRNAVLSLKEGSALPEGITMDADGNISGTPTAATPAGTATIVAIREGSAPLEFTINYGEVKVKNPVTGVSLDKKELVINQKASATLKATVTPHDASDAKTNWKSGDTSIAQVTYHSENSNVAEVTGVAAGTTTITVTTRQGGMTDHCMVYVKEKQPAAGIDYDKELLTGLENGGTYRVSASGLTAQVFTASGTTKAIDPSWLGKTLAIVRTNAEVKCESDAQNLEIPAREAAPAAVGAVDTSHATAADGKITGVTSAMQYRKQGETAWKGITGSEVTGLSKGTYEVRLKATSSAFAGNIKTVTIGSAALTFTHSAAFDIPSGTVGTAITAIDVSNGVKGGTKSYTFSKTAGPTWLTVSASGRISGTRPAGEAAATTMTIKVTDSASASKEISVAVGAVTKPAGYTITGRVVSQNSKNAVTVKLYTAGHAGEAAWEKYTAAVTQAGAATGVIGDFTFNAVAPGSYDLVITKTGHLVYTVKNIAVVSSNIDLTTNSNPAIRSMTLLCGDITGEGLINTDDLNLIWNVANYNRPQSEAVNKITDLNGDGNVNTDDLNIVWNAANYNKSAKRDCTVTF